jgi:hypothetical protein
MTNTLLYLACENHLLVEESSASYIYTATLPTLRAHTYTRTRTDKEVNLNHKKKKKRYKNDP